jgi:hypothetical protein
MAWWPHLGQASTWPPSAGRAAALNRPKRLELLKVEAPVIPVQEATALCAKDVGHLHGGPAHFSLVRW